MLFLSWEWMYSKTNHRLLFENMLFLSWELMYNWHPEYPAHVSECFPWVRTRVTRLQKTGSNHWVLTTMSWGPLGDPYSSLTYQRLRRFVTIRNFTSRISVAELYTCTDQNPDGPKRDKKTDRHTRIFVGQRRMAILCRPELVLFPACCCVIMLRLVCCFRYSWCVTRLMWAGRRPDCPWRKPFRTKHPYHRPASFFHNPIHKI